MHSFLQEAASPHLGTVFTQGWLTVSSREKQWLIKHEQNQTAVGAHFAVHLATRAPIYHNLQPHYLKQTNQTVKCRVPADACAKFEEIPSRSVLTLADGDVIFVKHKKAAATFSFKTNWPLTSTYCAGFVMTHQVKRPQVQKVYLPENYLKTIHLFCPHGHKMPDVTLNPSACGSSRMSELLCCRWGFSLYAKVRCHYVSCCCRLYREKIFLPVFLLSGNMWRLVCRLYITSHTRLPTWACIANTLCTVIYRLAGIDS